MRKGLCVGVPSADRVTVLFTDSEEPADVYLAYVDVPATVGVDPYAMQARDASRKFTLGRSVWVLLTAGSNRFGSIFATNTPDAKLDDERSYDDDDRCLAIHLLRHGLATLRPGLKAAKEMTDRLEKAVAEAEERGLHLHSRCIRQADAVTPIIPFPKTGHPFHALLRSHLEHATVKCSVEHVISCCVFEVMLLPSCQLLQVRLAGILPPSTPEAFHRSRSLVMNRFLHRHVNMALDGFDEVTGSFWGTVLPAGGTSHEKFILQELIGNGHAQVDCRSLSYSRYDREILAAGERLADAVKLFPDPFMGVVVGVLSPTLLEVIRLDANGVLQDVAHVAIAFLESLYRPPSLSNTESPFGKITRIHRTHQESRDLLLNATLGQVVRINSVGVRQKSARSDVESALSSVVIIVANIELGEGQDLILPLLQSGLYLFQPQSPHWPVSAMPMSVVQNSSSILQFQAGLLASLSNVPTDRSTPVCLDTMNPTTEAELTAWMKSVTTTSTTNGSSQETPFQFPIPAFVESIVVSPDVTLRLRILGAGVVVLFSPENVRFPRDDEQTPRFVSELRKRLLFQWQNRQVTLTVHRIDGAYLIGNIYRDEFHNQTRLAFDADCIANGLGVATGMLRYLSLAQSRVLIEQQDIAREARIGLWHEDNLHVLTKMREKKHEATLIDDVYPADVANVPLNIVPLEWIDEKTFTYRLSSEDHILPLIKDALLTAVKPTHTSGKPLTTSQMYQMFAVGAIVAAPYAGEYFRARVVQHVRDEHACFVIYLDYGSASKQPIPLSQLKVSPHLDRWPPTARMARHAFLSIPPTAVLVAESPVTASIFHREMAQLVNQPQLLFFKLYVKNGIDHGILIHPSTPAAAEKNSVAAVFAQPFGDFMIGGTSSTTLGAVGMFTAAAANPRSKYRIPAPLDDSFQAHLWKLVRTVVEESHSVTLDLMCCECIPLIEWMAAMMEL